MSTKDAGSPLEYDVIFEPVACDHGVTFDLEAACDQPPEEVRRRWPRLMGPCPKGCGYTGIAYASFSHYICGDW